MPVPIYQLDAFARHRFTGNPAAVMVLDAFPADATLQAIAAENNLAETAFLVPERGDYRLRWFTPTLEVPLCGHATLASAAVVMERLERGRTEVLFHSASGALPVRRTEGGYCLDFPVRRSAVLAVPGEAANAIAAALGVMPSEIEVNEFNYLALLPSGDALRRLAPDMAAVARLDRDGLIVTARGEGPYDFLSRYFAPAKGIPEDPATGSSHCMLAPYWAARLGQTDFRAWQCSSRGGEIACRVRGERVELEGGVVFYMEGVAEI